MEKLLFGKVSSALDSNGLDAVFVTVGPARPRAIEFVSFPYAKWEHCPRVFFLLSTTVCHFS